MRTPLFRLTGTPRFISLIKLVCLLMIGFLTLLPFSAVEASPTEYPQIRILYISSFESDSSDTAKVIEVLKQDLVAGGWRPEIYLQSLDTFRFPQTEKARKLFDDMLEQRYDGLRFNIILAQASEALRAAERYRQKLPYSPPVYCFDWIDSSLYERFSKSEGYFGRTLAMSFPPTLNLATRLFPDVKRINIVVSPVDPSHIPEFRRDLAHLRMIYPHIVFRHFINAEYDTVERALAESGADSLTLLLPGSWLLADGEQLGGRAALDRLDAAAPMPYFGITIDSFGSGLVGGCFVDREQMGHEAAIMISRILKIDGTFSFWAESGALLPVLDYRALKRFSVAESRIPSDARILYSPQSVWIRFEIPIKIAIFVMLALLIGLLVFGIIRQREQQILINTNAKLELKVTERTAELTHANDELMTANESLRDVIDELDEANKRVIVAEKLAALGRLTANISHELNTPLAAISSASHTLMINIYSGLNAFAEDPMCLGEEAFAFIREAMESVRQSRLNAEWCGSAAERAAYRKVEAVLTEAGLHNAESIAQELVELGIADLATRALPLMKSANADTFVAVLRATLGAMQASSVIDDSVTKANRVVLMLRTYARSGESDDAQNTALIGVVKNVLRLIVHVNPAVTVDVTVRNDLNVFCRLEDLKSILYNIMKNAMQAMRDAGQIIVSAEEKDDFVYVSVTDFGVGIPESIRDRVFEPFFSTKPMGEGAGFGLDVARRLARRNGGDIYFESKPGLTVFTVLLPKQRL